MSYTPKNLIIGMSNNAYVTNNLIYDLLLGRYSTPKQQASFRFHLKQTASKNPSYQVNLKTAKRIAKKALAEK